MGPDYAQYDAQRLRQARRTMDATRYPDRARELDERIAALAAGQAPDPGKAAARSVDRSADLPVLQRVGRVLLVIGVLDLCLMVYCIVRGISYSSSFTAVCVRRRSCAGTRGCGRGWGSFLSQLWSLSRLA